MSKELALVPTKEEFDIIQMMAKTAAESKHFEKIGGFAGLFSIALYAREMGISPMVALHGGLVPVMGKITMSSEMMNSLIRQKGHKLEILESSDKLCRIKGTRKDTGETYTCSFSIEDARRAGLIKNGGGYDKHTDDMLFARCISKIKRRLFPDVACKAYVEGEIEEADSVEEKEDAPVQVEGIAIPSTMSVEHVEELHDLIQGDAEYIKKIVDHYKVDSLEEIEDKYFDVIRKRASQKAKQKEVSVFDDLTADKLPI